MPSDTENVQYLYLVLTHNNTPTIDWTAVGAAMNLKPGAVSKRWSRLKIAMAKGDAPSPSVYPFLWLCIKHSVRATNPDWSAIAALAGTTAGAASKRYSRMKQAFEAGDAPPGAGGSPAKSTPGKTAPKTPKKAMPGRSKAAKTMDEDDADESAGEHVTATPSKRKRTPTAKTSVVVKRDMVEHNKGTAPTTSATTAASDEDADDDDDDDDASPSKKPKPAAKPTAAFTPINARKHDDDDDDDDDAELPTPSATTEASTLIKPEHVDGDEAFFDAEEGVAAAGGGEQDAEQDA